MHWKKRIEKILKNDRVMGVSMKIFVKNQDLQKKFVQKMTNYTFLKSP